jgi:hypothetical protein
MHTHLAVYLVQNDVCLYICSCCCCIKWSLLNAVRYFALFQMFAAFASLLGYMISMNESTMTSWSTQIIDIGLAIWVLDAGIKRKQLPPIMNFAFAQFLLAVQSGLNTVILTIYYFALAGNSKDDRGFNISMGFVNLFYGIYTTVYKFESSYLTWSFAQNIKEGRYSSYDLAADDFKEASCTTATTTTAYSEKKSMLQENLTKSNDGSWV